MRKIFLLLFLFTNSIFIFAQNREEEYIKKHALLAVKEMWKYNIPASITLAQGIIETGGGQSRLAEQANNHFGIKCKEEWKGGKIYHDDDALGECFRKYDSVEESFEDHSKFLAFRPYYKRLFNLDKDDYKGWAHGLKKAGYATNPRYAYMLISKIEKYKLYDFDKLSPYAGEVYTELASRFGKFDKKQMVGYNPKEQDQTYVMEYKAPKTLEHVKEKESKETRQLEQANELNEVFEQSKPKPINQQKTIVKKIPLDNRRIRIHPIGRRYIILEKGETLNQIAKAYDIKEKRLLCYNDLKDQKQIQAGQYFFLEKKRNKGSKPNYKVQKGDTMYSISQKMGIKLECLYYRNRMKEGAEPNVGDVLYLRGRKPRT